MGKACNWVEDWDDAIRYYKRAKEGYEEQLGSDDEKTLEATYSLITSTADDYIEEEFIEKLRDLVKRCDFNSFILLKLTSAFGSKLRIWGITRRRWNISREIEMVQKKQR